MKTLILSDLHLGSKNCHVREILEVLERVRFDRLVLNGDTLHGLNLKKLNYDHWTAIDRLRKLKDQRQVVLLRGNHDYDRGICWHASDGQKCFAAPDVLPALLGIPMEEEFRLDVAGKPYLVLHGDQFDPTLHTLASEMACWCYQVSRRFNKKLGKWLKKKAREYGGLLETIRTKAAAHARRLGFDGVFLGHTHHSDDSSIEDTHYVNSGSWTEPPCSYVTVERDVVSLKHLPD